MMRKRPARITLLQVNPSARGTDEHVKETIKLVERTAERVPGIVILPEIWSGGFKYPEIVLIASRTPKILQELQRISRLHNSLIIGSLPERRSGKLFNTAAIIDQGRIVGRYRKQRLFSPMNEDRHFVAGRSRKTFATSFGTVAVAICFDLRFPELFTGLRDRGVHLLVVPAQWPEPRCLHWERLLVARAIENQTYVAGCNRAGRMHNVRFCGCSMIVDPWGVVLKKAGTSEQVISSWIDPGRIEEVRRQIPMGRAGRS